MEGVSTDSLRALAPKWSLAGDDQLLNLLQSTHQRIISKCESVNSRLEEMAAALDGASIDLQNVNNRFMALSNSQFIESRVYDDDADMTADTPAVKAPPPPAAEEASLLRASVAALARAHDTAEILDDSDSDSDVEISVVLKPKDMYSHRPLPYIIGSQAWKNKWHAGLLVEDSDTDSSTSKRDRDIEQYSDSEEEISRPPLEEHTLSESGSSLAGSVGAVPPAPPAPPARPADVAAALARRLAGDSTKIVQEEPEVYPAAAPAPVKVYKPEQPATSAIFSDEPPPLLESDESSDEDIFAEINKHTPYTQRNKVQSNLADDLFSFTRPAPEEGDIFSDFAPTLEKKQPAKSKSILFEGESEPELFAEQPSKKDTQSKPETDESNFKKPVGGISLFGSNEGAENIGAAILKRNQQRPSSFGDESRSENIKNQVDENPTMSVRDDEESKAVDETDKSMSKKEKDIFDDLFSKSEKIQKKTSQAKEPPKATPVKEKVAPAKQKANTNVKDLFSDNIFDDIDDIFTSNVKIPSKESNQKSIFDDDDLFSDIGISKTTNQDTNKSAKDNKTSVKDIKTSVKDTKSLFDSDDELFSEVKTDANKPVVKNIATQPIKDNLSDNNKDTHKNINSELVSKTENIKEPIETSKERNLFEDSPQIVKPESKTQMKSKSIFDSDSDDGNDIFAKLRTPDSKTIKGENKLGSSDKNSRAMHKEELLKPENNNSENQLTIENIQTKEKKLVQSPSLFEEDEIDDLFIAANKLKKTNENKDMEIAEVKKLPSVLKEAVIDNVSKENEIDTSIVVANIEIENDYIPESPLHTEPETIKKLDLIPNENVTSSKTKIFEDDLSNDPREIPELIESSQKLRKPEIIQKTKAESNTITDLSFNENKNQVKTAIISKVEKSEEENGNQSLFVDLPKPAEEKESFLTESNILVSNTDIFDDIFTEPPAFEKVAEPKKSKNINALFDDDSDDESLFFKKDDVISDEKPDIFSKNANFDIFVDEPPAIDVDFTTKPSKNADINDDLFNPVRKTDDLVQSSKSTNQSDENNIVSQDQEKNENVPRLIENIGSDYKDELFNSDQICKSVPKSLEVDNNVNIKPMPKTEENVPDNVKVIKEKTIDDKPISNQVSEILSTCNVKKIEDEDLFSPQINKDTDKTIVEKTNALSAVDSDEELFASLPNLPTSSQKHHNNSKANVEKYKTDDFVDIFKSESPKKDTEIKKIGKINTKNFNINVNALMPGASPKKIPKERKDEQSTEIQEPRTTKIIPDEPDFETNPTTNKDENHSTVSSIESVNLLNDETDFKSSHKDDSNRNQQEPHATKSIAFDDKSESGVLDNNVSKQRPRIQVKRRPSSRKARHEAVRKSAIDFSDETDNSSSFDEPKPRNVVSSKPIKLNDDSKHKEDEIFSKDNTSKEVNNINENYKKLSDEDNPIIESIPSEIDITKGEVINTQTEEKSDIFESISRNIPSHKDNEPASIPKETDEARQNLNQNLNESKQTTTKIVYILNDEDIFSTESKNTDKPENLFKSKDSKSDTIKDTDIIKTLGKTYKEDTEKKNNEEFTQKRSKEEIKKIDKISPKDNKTSLFDDSDDELFNKNKKIVKKTTIFDSDSEEDLFSGKKSTEKKSKEVRNKEVKERKDVVVKGSLFGDDDDDDDLFGVKKDKAEPKHQTPAPSTSKEASFAAIASKTAEPVFDDPLSMLGDDD